MIFDSINRTDEYSDYLKVEDEISIKTIKSLAKKQEEEKEAWDKMMDELDEN